MTIDIDPKQYDEVTDRVARVIAALNIHGLNGHIIVDTTGKIPTACWCFNKKTNEFSIKLGYELLLKLDDQETLGILEHELLHHVHYRNCDIRNHLMSNIVLDVAINKILYLCNPSVTESWARKVYPDDIVEKMSASASVLVCPHLSPEQIENILDPDVKETYIDVWGSRQTLQDFNTDVPVPLNLYYRLIQFIEADTVLDSEFGEMEENDDPSRETSDGEGKDGEKTDQKRQTKPSKKRCDDTGDNDEDGEKEQETSDKSEEQDSDSKQGSSSKDNESDDNDEQQESSDGGDEQGEDSSDKTSGDDQDESEDTENEKDNEQEDDSVDTEKGETGDDEEDEQPGSQGEDDQESGYRDISDELEQFAADKEDQAQGAGKGRGKMRFTFAPPPELDSAEVELRLKERIFEATIDEIGELVTGSLANNILRQPFVTRPTRTTLTHIACGVSDYLPVYYNHVPGQSAPKVGCYVDVSGSMQHHMHLVHAIMTKIGEFLPSVSFVFDTNVLPIPTLAWNEYIPLGGGTDFDSVLKHACLSRDVKQEWLDKWIKKYATDRESYGYHTQNIANIIVEQIQRLGIQADLLNEDFPVILMVTDGENSISSDIQQQFEATGKQLIVLLLTDRVIDDHAFINFERVTVVQINSSAKIIDRGTD